MEAEAGKLAVADSYLFIRRPEWPTYQRIDTRATPAQKATLVTQSGGAG